MKNGRIRRYFFTKEPSILYNVGMVEIGIGTNEKGQRIDRFLRKYLAAAPLSMIYRVIRKDAKVNGKRVKNDYILEDGDIVTLYLTDEATSKLTKKERRRSAKRSFAVAYESKDVLIADKPMGLLTHGDRTEKKDHLANQVLGYLTEKGEYDPAQEKTFVPAPVNRLDRNTTGLVIFAKNYDALKAFNAMLRTRESVSKKYITLVKGSMEKSAVLAGSMEKNEETNTSTVSGSASEKGKDAVTIVRPKETCEADGIDGVYTLVEAEIETGRTHQIRVQLAACGHPIVGDRKYGDPGVNKAFAAAYGVSSQLLTAYELEFGNMPEEYSYMEGLKVKARLPGVFSKVIGSMKECGPGINK